MTHFDAAFRFRNDKGGIGRGICGSITSRPRVSIAVCFETCSIRTSRDHTEHEEEQAKHLVNGSHGELLGG